jgi:hypothetical protein
MKSIALTQSTHYADDLNPSSTWSGSEEKSTRCKSVDSFNFLMHIIDPDRYVDRSQGKPNASIVELSNRASWQADFYKDDYDTVEDNRKSIN